MPTSSRARSPRAEILGAGAYAVNPDDDAPEGRIGPAAPKATR